MGLEERRNRHEALMRLLRKHDIKHWREEFVRALSGVEVAAAKKAMVKASK